MSDPYLVVVGDPHGRVAELCRQIAEQHPTASAVIFLGDLTLDQPLTDAISELPDSMEVAFIPGNHDYDRPDYYDYMMASGRAVNLDGVVVTMGGMRLAGLGGHFQGKIWYPPGPPRFQSREVYEASLGPVKKSGVPDTWREGTPLRVLGAIWSEDVDRLAQESADILFSHEAPSTHRHGFEELDRVASCLGVSRLVHGHQHESYEAFIGDGLLVIGLGLAEIRAVTICPLCSAAR
ncbi:MULTISPECIES: metallophosphoesterase [unclassified Thioalkalivibrio]|uniref:metallophosphoesterase family protein n=1 Tax=unclassified Thioalkalivibrio TaxID=2621013 RepID=UPI0009DA454F|nr:MULTISPECIES: metallophosphoesterase [unclassified Thioalkalivibrio]